jgi:hypothetical protein
MAIDVISYLTKKVAEVAPIDGLSYKGGAINLINVRIDFKEAATPAERTAGRAVIQNFQMADYLAEVRKELREEDKDRPLIKIIVSKLNQLLVLQGLEPIDVDNTPEP